MSSTFGVVDLFAGPGGMGEGFASFRVGDRAPFDIRISVEKEASAHQTLTLRAFLREYRKRHGNLPQAFLDLHAGKIVAPDWNAVDAGAWSHASDEARRLELGTAEATTVIMGAIKDIKREFGDNTILIGGPPCQAYSLAGRARSRAKPDYVPENDPRHYLFREYLHVLDCLRPAVFVMENVKGMLSSTVESRHVFEMLMEELASLGSRGRHLYELRAVRVDGAEACFSVADQPKDFVVRADEFGVPQQRHRVIIIGVRADLAPNASRVRIPLAKLKYTVNEAIGGLPRLRSGLTRGEDSASLWRDEVGAAAHSLAQSSLPFALKERFRALEPQLHYQAPVQRSTNAFPADYGCGNNALMRWLENRDLLALAQHETRGHMAADLKRYLFAAVFAQEYGRSPKAPDFPARLSPEHKNWRSGVFSDRFRVQLNESPSSTVTSHIAKDGHYFIHPDPLQCRSLTVREAARLQTFPDDYLFLGNRTQQYVQVGNAVPPLLAHRIAEMVHRCLENC